MKKIFYYFALFLAFSQIDVTAPPKKRSIHDVEDCQGDQREAKNPKPAHSSAQGAADSHIQATKDDLVKQILESIPKAYDEIAKIQNALNKILGVDSFAEISLNDDNLSTDKSKSYLNLGSQLKEVLELLGCISNWSPASDLIVGDEVYPCAVAVDDSYPEDKNWSGGWFMNSFEEEEY